MPSLFSSFERNYFGVKGHTEPSYVFLDRSARPHAEVIRSTFDQWFAQYPADQSIDLLRRFKSKDEDKHESAAFELYLHQLFCRLGYIVDIHPTTHNSRRPDFLLEDSTGRKLYVEAVVARGESERRRAERARFDTVIDAINRKLKPTDWFIGVSDVNYPNKPPSIRKLLSILERWLAEQSADEAIKNYGQTGDDALPTLNYKDADLEIAFTAFPRAVEKRENPVESAVGIIFGDAGWSNDREIIRDALLFKANRYGNLDAPLVIAISANVIHLDNIDAMEALFGQEQYIFNRSKPNQEPRMERMRNGFWYGSKGSQYTRVPAVLIGSNMGPWTFGVTELTLYQNPWVEDQISGPICALTRRVPENFELVLREGRRARDILQLSEGYPGIVPSP